MPRNRMIKTEFWNDEKMAQVSRDARLTFIALWNLSDDYGSVRGHPLWLKNTIYPYDDIKQADFKKWLEELENVRAILPYDGDGEKFYYIRCFTKHQVIGRPSQFRNPPPPDTILEYSMSPQGVLADETKRESKSKSERESKPVNDGGNFLRFWSAYPKKVGKIDALKAWKKNGRPEIAKILEAVAKQRASPQWLKEGGKFIPNPATWLNGGRWDDQPTEEYDEADHWLKSRKEAEERGHEGSSN
jgi:hypothetical protein